MSGAAAYKAGFGPNWAYEHDFEDDAAHLGFDAAVSHGVNPDMSMALRKRQFRPQAFYANHSDTQKPIEPNCRSGGKNNLFVVGFITFFTGLVIFFAGFLFPETSISLVGSGIFTIGSGCIAWFVMENGPGRLP